MAHNSASFNFDAEQEGIAIAIGAGRDDPQPVARTLAFGPQPVSGPAVKRDVALRNRSRESVWVHESHHKDLAVRCVLDYGGNQPGQFAEIKLNIHTFSPKQKAR